MIKGPTKIAGMFHTKIGGNYAFQARPKQAKEFA